jgi:hypothetical protein
MEPQTTGKRTSKIIQIIIVLAFLAGVASLAFSGPAHADFPAFADLLPEKSAGADTVSAGAAPAGSAPAAAPPSPSIAALPLDGGAIPSPRIDGRLDDAAWQTAQPGTGFRVWETDRGATPSQPTVFKIAYDARALYFGVACRESEPARIHRNLARRDRVDGNTDCVSLYLDPFSDGNTGYLFRVNSAGVQLDGYLFNDGDRDDNWDAVWQAETFHDRDGWYAEVRIPFSSIRYRADAPTWGLQVIRSMPDRGEDDAWTIWDRNASGFVSRFGRLTGLTGIPSPRQLEIVPYAVARATDPSAAGADDRIDRFENVGADIRYGITPNLGLNATIQPDFGQVEADPANLNLSPFETYYEEKRPFFTEGNGFFQAPDWNVFYSRRIGTGGSTSRIRYAAKVTGKAQGNISIGALAAATDVTGSGQSHNLFKPGADPTEYFVGRIGREFRGGKHSIYAMQTHTARDGRQAETTESDFDLRFGDRAYRIHGSFVGSVISPGSGRSRTYGTGGRLELRRTHGSLWAGLYGRWIDNRLDLNDVGYLSSGDIIRGSASTTYSRSAKDKTRLINYFQTNFNVDLAWLYAARTGYDLRTGAPAWSYGRGRPQIPSTNVNGWCRFRNMWEGWYGLSYNFEGIQRYETRGTVLLADGSRVAIPGGGALIAEPRTWGGWIGGNTNGSKDLVLNSELTYFADRARNVSTNVHAGVRWNQSDAISHELSSSISFRRDDTEHIDNYENPNGGGIGGVDYVFGEIHQRTVNVTLRSSLLFSRNSSLEAYVQPYITLGRYTNPRSLAEPGTYNLSPYAAPGFRAAEHDFHYASANLNIVYRWEYRPGSTFYLVWTQSRASYVERWMSDATGERYTAALAPHTLTDPEPENVFLAKITYWLPI